MRGYKILISILILFSFKSLSYSESRVGYFIKIEYFNKKLGEGNTKYYFLPIFKDLEQHTAQNERYLQYGYKIDSINQKSTSIEEYREIYFQDATSHLDTLLCNTEAYNLFEYNLICNNAIRIYDFRMPCLPREIYQMNNSVFLQKEQFARVYKCKLKNKLSCILTITKINTLFYYCRYKEQHWYGANIAEIDEVKPLYDEIETLEELLPSSWRVKKLSSN